MPPAPGPAIALDVGTAKIGVAYTDAGRRMAFPDRTVLRAGVRRDAEQLAALARARGATARVVGLPDAGGRMERLARQVGDAVGALLALEPQYVDEGYTSAEARARIEAAGAARRDVDAWAAMVILEAWLARAAEPPG